MQICVNLLEWNIFKFKLSFRMLPLIFMVIQHIWFMLRVELESSLD